MKERKNNHSKVNNNLTDTNQNKSIGIVLKDLVHPSYNSIISGVKDYADKKGYNVIITSSNNNHELEKGVISLLSSTEVNGIIIDPILEDLTEIEHLFNLKINAYPFVLLKDIPGINASVITIDNSNAIRKVVKYLINSGHTKIVHFAGPPSSFYTQERVEGFRYAFSESSLVFNKNMIVPIGDDYNESYKNTLRYFKKKNRKDYPTAIVCFNDSQALAVMIALNKLNINVPEDVSIIGNDDISYADIYPVPLTTIRTPYYQIGIAASKLLIKNIELSGPEKVEHIVMETEFVVRKSSRIINKQKPVVTS